MVNYKLHYKLNTIDINHYTLNIIHYTLCTIHETIVVYWTNTFGHFGHFSRGAVQPEQK